LRNGMTAHIAVNTYCYGRTVNGMTVAVELNVPKKIIRDHTFQSHKQQSWSITND